VSRKSTTFRPSSVLAFADRDISAEKRSPFRGFALLYFLRAAALSGDDGHMAIVPPIHQVPVERAAFLFECVDLLPWDRAKAKIKLLTPAALGSSGKSN